MKIQPLNSWPGLPVSYSRVSSFSDLDKQNLEDVASLCKADVSSEIVFCLRNLNDPGEASWF